MILFYINIKYYLRYYLSHSCASQMNLKHICVVLRYYQKGLFACLPFLCHQKSRLGLFMLSCLIFLNRFPSLSCKFKKQLRSTWSLYFESRSFMFNHLILEYRVWFKGFFFLCTVALLVIVATGFLFLTNLFENIMHESKCMIKTNF